MVGLCHAQGAPLLASEGYAEIQAFVAAHTHQLEGILKDWWPQSVNERYSAAFTGSDFERSCIGKTPITSMKR